MTEPRMKLAPANTCLLNKHSYFSNIRKQSIAACLEAMLAERRFTYTDLFVKGAP